MTFARWWPLLLALLPFAWVIYEWRRTSRAQLLFKALSLAAIAAAIAEPRLAVNETKMAAALLVDTSTSVSSADLVQASRLVNAIEKERGRHATLVVPFAGQSRRTANVERNGGEWAFRHTSGDAGRSTNVEGALREALALLPAGVSHRLVLLSDGKENRGSMARAAWQARQAGIPIDTYALAGRAKPQLRLESASMPVSAFTGERFGIELQLHSPVRHSGVVEITAEGKPIGQSTAVLEPGVNRVRVQTAINEPGAINISVRVRVPDSGDLTVEQAVTLRRPRVLLVSSDPSGTEVHLVKALEASGFELSRGVSADNGTLASTEIVILNNQDLRNIPAAQKTALEQFVQRGGGLLVIGGERNLYTEERGPEDALERAMPAKLAPPRSPEGMCVVLIVDKSSSMEGRKMELARLAAIGVIENLRPIDLVGVLIFDNSFQWAVPIRKAEDRTLIKRLVAGIMPDGGTQIAPALAEAYRRIQTARATYRHIVLLTDGISEEGDSISLAREAALQRVTISTVGLGQDVNRAYLEKVASFSKGKSYFLVDPSGLEQILIRDVMEHTGSTAIEKPLQPAVVKRAEVLEGIGWESAPPLKGYVRFTAKPSAETLLAMDVRDPLLTRWQYGLGRSAVFASDAKSRWAEAWIGWPGYDLLWANIVRDLLPRASAGEAVASFDSTSQELVVDYRLASHSDEPQAIPQIFVIGPNGFQKAIAVRRVADRTYQGRAKIGDARGLFRIRPVAESQVFPETGFYRQEEELATYGSNEALLREISSFTGGTHNPSPASIFRSATRTIPTVFPLWPVLLGIALLLNLIDLVARKWTGLGRLLGGRTATEETNSPGRIS